MEERMLLKLTAIIDGEFVPYYTEDVSVIAYLRVLDGKELLVIHNYQDKRGGVQIPDGFEEKVLGNRDSADW